MKKLLLTTVFFTSFAVVAETSPGELFKSLDKDGNGSLSKTEVAGEVALASKFKEFDRDENGEISTQEFIAYFESKK
ncbi:EF-hand domain-containing protein [Aliikangiella coralliicola]|uniref:Calmodulin n=1 Tax=Aliikangiella coralliicola TaxID=2592383 RepID=A0A545UGX4_9GAMM|nr:EF-hand domain-containing protein [Aliikangiella coralliicola]TQV88728.1 calmodulin [Aliikangiella coralliicola]